jgi:hypothetical protein
VDDEDEALPLGALPDRGAPGFLLSYGLGEEPLPLLRFGPQLVPVGLYFGLPRLILPALLFYAVFGSVQDFLDRQEDFSNHVRTSSLTWAGRPKWYGG